MSKGFAWLVGGAVAAMLMSALFLPATTPCGGYESRRAETSFLLSQLELAVESYEKAFGEYPPGDGQGSRELVRALRRPGPQKRPFFDRPDELVDGELRNPILFGSPVPEGVVRYRRNPPGSRPPFRLFVSDGRGGELSAP